MKKIVLLLILLPKILWSQADLLLDTGNVVVVTAQRQAVKAFDLAESVSVLSQKELNTQVSRSTAEALIGAPGVWMQKTNHGGGSPFIRGLTGNQTLLLLDGIRLNNSTYRYGPNQYFNTINVLNIEQIEIVRGSGSVLFGSDAIGGTINILTHSPEFSEAYEHLKTQVLGRLISQGMEQSGAANLRWSGRKAAIVSNYSYRDFGDLVAGGSLGKELASSYKEQAASAKMKVKIGPQSILTFAYDGVFQSEVGRYDQVVQRGYQVYQFDPQNRQLAYIKGQIGTNQKFWQQLEWTTSWQFSEEERNKLRENASLWENELDQITTLGLNLQVHSNLSTQWKLITGLESYWDQIQSTAWDWDQSNGQRTEQRGLYPDDSRAANVAVYTSLTGDFTRLRLNGGLRYNFFKLSPNDQNFSTAELSPRALVGNLSAHFTLAQKHALVATANTAFRAPNINDLSSFGAFDFGIEVPAPGLKPERSLNLELGYKFQTNQAQVNLAVYRIRLYELINRIRGTYQGQETWEGQEVYIRANTSDAYIQGIEWDGSWLFHPKWLIKAMMSYTYGQDLSAEMPLRRIPPFNGSLNLRFQPSAHWTFAYQNWFAGSQTRLSDGDISDHRIAEGGTPGWMVTNLNIGVNQNWWQINAGLQNLFNTAYRIHGSGVDGTGRSVWLSLSINWERILKR